MAFLYQTHGTCSRNIILEMDGDIIKDVDLSAAATATSKASVRWCAARRRRTSSRASEESTAAPSRPLPGPAGLCAAGLPESKIKSSSET